MNTPITREPSLTSDERTALVRRGQRLSRITLIYNSAEGVLSIAAGAAAGSISLMGFGIDSAIEVLSSIAALWRLRSDVNPVKRERSERRTLRLIGASFLALAAYILADAARALYLRSGPEKSLAGIVIAASSVVVMPLLARAKRRVGVGLGSRALTADATQTSLCTWLSAIVLVGVGLNSLLGWWWADPLAALCMVPIIAKEGIEGSRAERHDDHCC